MKNAKGANNATDKTKGAQQSTSKPAPAPQAPAAPAAGNQSDKKAVAVPLKKMPPMKGDKGGKKGVKGTKALLYMLFAIPYSKWTDFARFIANAIYVQHFAEGQPHTTENRLWIVQNATTGDILQTLNNADGIAYKAKIKAENIPNEVCQPWFSMNENPVKNARFVKCADLVEHFTEQAELLKTTNPELSAKCTEMAEMYSKENDYAGFVCCTSEHIGTIQENVRGYYAINPETEEAFTELKEYHATYGQAELPMIINQALVEEVVA